MTVHKVVLLLELQLPPPAPMDHCPPCECPSLSTWPGKQCQPLGWMAWITEHAYHTRTSIAEGKREPGVKRSSQTGATDQHNLPDQCEPRQSNYTGKALRHSPSNSARPVRGSLRGGCCCLVPCYLPCNRGLDIKDRTLGNCTNSDTVKELEGRSR